MAMIENSEGTFALIIPKIAGGGIWGGSGASIIAWLGGQNAVAWAGVGVGVLGLILNWWFKREMLRIERKKAGEK